MQAFITAIHHQTSSVKLGKMRTVKASPLRGHTPTSLTSNFEMICVCLPLNGAWMGSEADSVALHSSLLSYVPLEHCQWPWLGDDLAPWFSLLILFIEEYVVLRGWVPLLVSSSRSGTKREWNESLGFSILGSCRYSWRLTIILSQKRSEQQSDHYCLFSVSLHCSF